MHLRRRADPDRCWRRRCAPYRLTLSRRDPHCEKGKSCREETRHRGISERRENFASLSAPSCFAEKNPHGSVVVPIDSGPHLRHSPEHCAYTENAQLPPAHGASYSARYVCWGLCLRQNQLFEQVITGTHTTPAPNGVSALGLHPRRPAQKHVLIKSSPRNNICVGVTVVCNA